MPAAVILCAAAVLAADPAGPREAPDGLYLKLGGAFVLQQDAELLSVGGVPLSATMEFNTGWGVQGGVGYTWGWESGVSLSVEFEYAFRTAEIKAIVAPPLTLPASGQSESNSFMLNVIGAVDIVGGFGLYGGGGFGAAITNSDLTIDLGGPIVTFPGDTDTTVAWQFLAGVQWGFGAHLLLYGGVRYFDAGTVGFETFQSENKSLSLEAGLRFHF